MRTAIAVVALVLAAGPPSGAQTAKLNEECFTRVLMCGETLSGEVTNRDCAFTGNTIFGDRWRLPASTGMSIDLAAETQGFPALLQVAGDGVTAVTLSPSTPATAQSTYSLPLMSGSFAALISSLPGSALGSYTLSLTCHVPDPCYHMQIWQACAGHAGHRPAPNVRFQVQTAYRSESGHEGFGFNSTSRVSPGTSAHFGAEANSLMTKFLDHGDRVELRYLQFTERSYRMAVRDLRTGQMSFYRNAENECGDDARDHFDAAGDPGSCRPYLRGRLNPHLGCAVGKRFSVELDWRDPATGRSGKGKVPGGNHIGIRFGKDFYPDVVVSFKPVDTGVDILFGSFSDWEYTLKITDTTTGEVRTYFNPAGRICAVVDPDVFGG